LWKRTRLDKSCEKKGISLTSCITIGRKNEVHDIRHPKTLLSRTLVDYEEVKRSPNGRNIAFLEWREKSSEYVYCLIVYNLAKRKLTTLVEETDAQIARFKWVSNDLIQYSNESLEPNAKWIKVRITK